MSAAKPPPGVLLSIVAAVGSNNVIGVAGGLPWRLRADLRTFRALTMGKPMIMGRKTYESIGRVLDGRDIIVLTRLSDLATAGIFVAQSLEAALELAGERATARNAGEICVVGGGEIYRAAMPCADRLHITHIAAAPDGDTVFPDISPSEWTLVSREALPHSDGDTVTGEHATYARRG